MLIETIQGWNFNGFNMKTHEQYRLHWEKNRSNKFGLVSVGLNSANAATYRKPKAFLSRITVMVNILHALSRMNFRPGSFKFLHWQTFLVLLSKSLVKIAYFCDTCLKFMCLWLDGMHSLTLALIWSLEGHIRCLFVSLSTVPRTDARIRRKLYRIVSVNHSITFFCAFKIISYLE